MAKQLGLCSAIVTIQLQVDNLMSKEEAEKLRLDPRMVLKACFDDWDADAASLFDMVDNAEWLKLVDAELLWEDKEA